MCKGCYEEYFENKKKPLVTSEMVDLAKQIDDFYDSWFSGGALHIVLDDWNLEAHHIKWCLKDIAEDLRDPRVQTIGEALLKLKLPQRYEVLWMTN